MRQGSHDLVDGVADGEMRRGNVIALQEFLGETLARLQPGRCLARSEDTPAAPGKFVHHSQGEGDLGADNGQVRADLLGHRHQGVNVLHVGRQALSLFPNAAVSRRAIDLGNPRGLPQFPYQGMLTPPAADDEDFHSRRLTRLGGRGDDVKPGKTI